MAWKAEIIFGDGDVSGLNSIETVYDSASQTAYKLKYGARFGSQAPSIIYHTPDNAPRIPARATESNAQIFLTIHSKAADWDTVLNNNNKISRLINGAHSQAIRASINGTAQDVKVKITPDGATNPTYYTVQSGFMDMTNAYTTPDAVVNTEGREIVIALECDAGGRGDSFILRNDLPSSPHMIEDSNADGLADGLILNGTPTTTILTTNYLTGGKTQKIVTAATGGEGVSTANIAAAISSTAVAYAWILPSTVGGDKITVRLTDGGGNIIQTKDILYTDSTNVSDKSTLDNTGARYYRVVVSGTNSIAANFRFDVVRTSANATIATTFLIDNMYLQTGTTTAPSGWCSSSALKNRDDPTSTSAATQQQINYLDVWGIPGDLPAEYKIKLATSVVTQRSWYINVTHQTQYTPSVYIHWLDNSDISSTSALRGAWTDSASAGYTEGVAKVFTDSGANGNGTLSYYFTGASARRLFQFPFLVFPLLTASTGSVAVEVQVGGLGFAGQTLSRTLTVSNSWINITEMGLINQTGAFEELDDIPDTAEPTALNFVGISLNVSTVNIGDTVTVDGIVLFHQISDSTFMQVIGGGGGTAGELWMHSKTGRIVSDQTATKSAIPIGKLQELMPSIENRMVFLRSSSGTDTGTNIFQRHTLNDDNTITLEVTPRTSHLLGTS